MYWSDSPPAKHEESLKGNKNLHLVFLWYGSLDQGDFWHSDSSHKSDWKSEKFLLQN